MKTGIVRIGVGLLLILDGIVRLLTFGKLKVTDGAVEVNLKSR